MIEFLAKLLDTSDFPARWHCGNWTSGEGWLHIVSDVAIFGIGNHLHAVDPLFGLAPGTFPGKYEAFQQTLHPHDRERVSQEVARVLVALESPFNVCE